MANQLYLFCPHCGGILEEEDLTYEVVVRGEPTTRGMVVLSCKSCPVILNPEDHAMLQIP